MKIVGLVLLLVLFLLVIGFVGILMFAVFKDEFNEFDEIWKDEWNEHHINDRWYDGF